MQQQQISSLKVGTKITVYWPNEDYWYIGTVVKEKAVNVNSEDGDGDKRNSINTQSRLKVKVKYDEDDQTDWIDTIEDKWRLGSKHRALVRRKTQEKLSNLMIGSRIAIWWPMDNEYFTGTLTNALTKEMMDETNSNVPHLITYDDGDEEWTNLVFRKFKRIQVNAQWLKVGSRISVYNEDQTRYVRATLIKVNYKRGAKPHRIKYDEVVENEKRTEWINLNIVPFLDIKSTAEESPSSSD